MQSDHHGVRTPLQRLEVVVAQRPRLVRVWRPVPVVTVTAAAASAATRGLRLRFTRRHPPQRRPQPHQHVRLCLLRRQRTQQRRERSQPELPVHRASFAASKQRLQHAGRCTDACLHITQHLGRRHFRWGATVDTEVVVIPHADGAAPSATLERPLTVPRPLAPQHAQRFAPLVAARQGAFRGLPTPQLIGQAQRRHEIHPLLLQLLLLGVQRQLRVDSTRR